MSASSANTLLSSVLVTLRKTFSSYPCFIPLSKNKYIGEGIVDSVKREVFVTDQMYTTDENLRHMAGLIDQFTATPKEDQVTLAVRMNYVEEFSSKTPIDTLQISLTWPRFPFTRYIDNAVYSELEPIEAPHWQLRVIPREKVTQLRDQFAEVWRFQYESFPETLSFTDALSNTLQQLMMPDKEEMEEMIARVFEDTECKRSTALPALNTLKGAPMSSVFARFCIVAGELKCLQAIALFWRSFLWRLRECKASELGEQTSGPSIGLHLFGRRATIADFNQSIVQQKIELLRVCLEPPVEELPQPPFVTEDILQMVHWTQGQLAKDILDRTLIQAFAADVVAYRIKWPKASFDTFADWYSSRQYAKPDDRGLLELAWEDPAAPPSLFDNEKESEMAFHFLENMSSQQVFGQFFVTFFQTAMRIWVAEHEEQLNAYPYLRGLANTLDTKILTAWNIERTPDPGPVWSENFIPSEDHMRSVFGALDTLEEKVLLTGALEEKLVRDIVGPLVEHGIADVPNHYRCKVDTVFEPPITSTHPNHKPLVKEFILLSKHPSHRLFADIRRDSVRLATTRLL